MIIQESSAEDKLLLTLKNIEKARKGWVAITIHLSNLLPIYETKHMNIAVNTCGNILKNESGTIFHMASRDIVIICRMIDKETINSLILALRNLFIDDPLAYYGDGAENPDFYKTYSLDVDAQWLLLKERYTKPTAESKTKLLQTPTAPITNFFTKDLIASNTAKRQQRKTYQILVVEDEPFSRSLVTKTLKGYELLTAKNGTEALQTYALNFPDIVFLDIIMPDINGHQVLHEIVKHDPEAYIIMLSANSYKEDVLSAVGDGAKGFIVKPFTKEKLNEHIEKYTLYKEKKS